MFTTKVVVCIALFAAWAGSIHWKNERLKKRGETDRVAKRLASQKAWGKRSIVLPIFATLAFAYTGVQKTLAENHINKACDILWNSKLSAVGAGYGPGVNLLTDQQKLQISNAWLQAYAASTEYPRFKFFADWIDNYQNNLTGDATDSDIHNPINVWEYDIAPVCRSV
jgi:hypothetical protein